MYINLRSCSRVPECTLKHYSNATCQTIVIKTKLQITSENCNCYKPCRLREYESKIGHSLFPDNNLIRQFAKSYPGMFKSLMDPLGNIERQQYSSVGLNENQVVREAVARGNLALLDISQWARTADALGTAHIFKNQKYGPNMVEFGHFLTFPKGGNRFWPTVHLF